MSAAADIVAYGLAAGLSPVVFLGTIAILSSRGGVSNCVVFLCGLLASLTAVCVAVALLAGLLTPEDGDRTFASALQLVLGLLLLAFAWHERPGSEARQGGGGKIVELLDKLEKLTPKAALTGGALLVASPKRFAITVLAGLAISAAGVSTGKAVVLVVIYALLVSFIVWLVLLVYLLGGEHAESLLGRSRAWTMEHAHAVLFAVSLAFGLLFTLQAIAELSS